MQSKFLIPLLLCPALASAAIFSTDFTGYAIGDINGQDGWTLNDATPEAGAIIALGGVWGSGSRAATLGYVSPVIEPTVFLSHASATPLLSGGSPDTTFKVMFQVEDSDSGYGAGAEARDIFGFRLADASDNTLWSLYLTPFDQDPTPESDTAFHTFSWSTGNDPATNVLTSPLVSAEETYAYHLTVTFAPSGANDVAFNADINGAAFSGIIPGQASNTIDRVGAFWTPLNGPTDPGSNFLTFDQLSVVPETSSAMLGLLGVTGLMLRRKRA